jgi:hypothetical protein
MHSAGQVKTQSDIVKEVASIHSRHNCLPQFRFLKENHYQIQRISEMEEEIVANKFALETHTAATDTRRQRIRDSPSSI